MVEEDEDHMHTNANNMMEDEDMNMSTKITENDTLINQSRVTSKEQYSGNHFNILENMENMFE